MRLTLYSCDETPAIRKYIERAVKDLLTLDAYLSEKKNSAHPHPIAITIQVHKAWEKMRK